MEGDGYLCAVRRRAVNKPVGDRKTVNQRMLGKNWRYLPQQVLVKTELAWAVFIACVNASLTGFCAYSARGRFWGLWTHGADARIFCLLSGVCNLPASAAGR